MQYNGDPSVARLATPTVEERYDDRSELAAFHHTLDTLQHEGILEHHTHEGMTDGISQD